MFSNALHRHRQILQRGVNIAEPVGARTHLSEAPISGDRLPVIYAALQRNLDQFQTVRDFEVDDLIEPAPIFSATGK